jgi:hypothetical protein
MAENMSDMKNMSCAYLFREHTRPHLRSKNDSLPTVRSACSSRHCNGELGPRVKGVDVKTLPDFMRRNVFGSLLFSFNSLFRL